MADNRYFEPVRLPTGTTTAATTDERVTSFLKRVYGWMFVGLSFIARGIRFYLLAFLLNRYGPQARVIIEERLTFWVTLSAVILVLGVVGALYLF